MEPDHAVMLKEVLTDDMQTLAVEGLARYGADVQREISTEEEAAYRLCHHDFYGLTQGEAAQVLGVTQQAIDKRLRKMRATAPQLFPILSRNVAAIYNRFTTDNMSVREIADDLSLSPRYCWQVLQDLWNAREDTGLYFRAGTSQRLHYRPWMDEHVKENW
jgi:hypothetical protein